MAELHGLIRLREHELEECRRDLGRLNEQRTALENRKKDRLDRLKQEKKLAACQFNEDRVNEDRVNESRVGDIGLFIEQTLKACDQLDRQVAQLLPEIEAATDAVREAFLELKRLQITQERRDAVETARLKKLEREVLDEIGLQSFQRADEKD